MALDVLALQYLYGKNPSTNAGDSVFQLQRTNYFNTLWDASGTDTIDASGALNADAFFVGAGAHDTNDRFIYNSANGNLMYDADGTGAQAATTFAVLELGLPLAAGDFYLM